MSSSSSEDEDDGCSTPRQEALNISNDCYYQPVVLLKPNQKLKATSEDLAIPKYGSKTIQHSLPAYDLWRPIFPTYLSEEKFKVFHRPKLRHYNTGPQSRHSRRLKAFPVKSLTRTIYRFQKKLRNKVAKAINDGFSREEIIENILLIRNAKDLTAKHGELFLFEYCEEHPPVLSQIGMACNVKTYIQSDNNIKLNKTASTTVRSKKSLDGAKSLQNEEQNTSDQIHHDDTSLVREIVGNYKIGIEQVISEQNTTKQIYYHKFKPGDRFQVIENNMYRAPIFQHEIPSSDFLVIRTRNSFYIRSVKTIFTVGQTIPLVAIPKPSENAINKFRSDLSKRYIHNLFSESDADPPSISLDKLSKSFPDYYRVNLRKRLIRSGVIYSGSGDIYYRGSSAFGLVPLKELRQIFTPEQYCLNMASLAARERLRALNYTESMINHTNNAQLEAEILAAPWNTSEAVLSALTSRHYLDFKGHLIDPTGPQREGFSCIPWVKSPTEVEQANSQKEESKSTTRRPSIAQSKQAPVSMQNPFALKIRREKLERLATYQREAQLINEVQTNVLRSHEILSSDESEEDDGQDDEENILDESFDEQLRDLDKMVTDGRTRNELNFEKEEEERQQMLRYFNQNEKVNQQDGLSSQKFPLRDANRTRINAGAFENKILKITRTYKTEDGKIERRIEIVREPKIIALYIQQKGGSIKSQNSQKQQMDDNSGVVGVENGHDVRWHNMQKTTFCSNDINSKQPTRRQSINLGPTELCRAEGLRLTISKSVLDTREMRRRRRHSILE